MPKPGQTDNHFTPRGNSVACAIGIANPATAGNLNPNLGAGLCAIEADVVNANPISPPFDD